MKNKSELRIDLAGNPGVAAYFSGKEPGDKCEFTITATVKEIDPANDVVLGIDKLTHEEGDDKEETEVVPSEDEPMKMEVTAKGPPVEDMGVSLGKALRVATKGAMKEDLEEAY